MVDPSLVDAPPAGGRWGHEAKWDGYRAQAHLSRGRCQLFTRKGNDWTKPFGPVAVAVTELPADDAILDGEIVALGKDGLSDFHELRRQLGAREPRLVYQVFDLLWLDGDDLRPLPYAERKARLRALLTGAGPPLELVDWLEVAGRHVLEGACRLGLEGIVSKRLDSPYRAGRSSDWLKAKCAVSETFAVVGFSRDDNDPSTGSISAASPLTVRATARARRCAMPARSSRASAPPTWPRWNAGCGRW
jgi:bifunctional non-homologous end joining protein LigD